MSTAIDFKYRDYHMREGSALVHVNGTNQVLIEDANGTAPAMSVTNCFEIVAAQVASFLLGPDQPPERYAEIEWYEIDSEGDGSRVELGFTTSSGRGTCYYGPKWTWVSINTIFELFPSADKEPR